MTDIQRDRYGRPLVIPPDGGRPVAYNRASSFGNVLDDVTNLTKWQLRMAAKGLTDRPDLYLAVLATPLDDKYKLNDLIQQAIEHAGGSRAATTGTALHQLTELIDLGQPLPVVPEQHRADLDAYRRVTSRFEMVHIEKFMVCDELQVAGTPDRLMRDLTAPIPAPTERLDLWGNLYEDEDPQLLLVGDLKTGGHAGYLGKYASQLAIYAHSDLYDPATGDRTPVDVDRETGWVFHMPAGEGRCDLYRLDLKAGWDAALLAADVRAYRKRKSAAVAA